MGKRLTKIYTRRGDDGSTVLGNATRISKDNIRVEVMGDLDELNSVLGIILSKEQLEKNIRDTLTLIQHELFDIGAEICIPGAEKTQSKWVENIERDIDNINSRLSALEEFILPGGGFVAAMCHFARTICRRAERHLITLQKKASVNPITIQYVNRLSDLLFVVARQINKSSGKTETQWQPKKN